MGKIFTYLSVYFGFSEDMTPPDYSLLFPYPDLPDGVHDIFIERYYKKMPMGVQRSLSKDHGLRMTTEKCWILAGGPEYEK